MSTRDLFDTNAEEGSEDDESFDEDTGEVRRKQSGTNGQFDDSSEEEEDDDDEEAAREVQEGFIVDEDEDDEEQRRRRRERKKRRREEREEEALDEEDLDLIGELPVAAPTESKFKRLKRGHRDDSVQREPRGVDDIFADEDDIEEDFATRRRTAREQAGEFDDFIEDDEFPDEEREQLIDDIEVSRRPKKGMGVLAGLDTSILDEASAEDMRAAFGDGTEYDWALELQEAMDDEQIDPDKPLELKDVFEPSQLKDKMLTDEDNMIRATDAPERFQIARKNFVEQQLSEEEGKEQIQEESKWISQLLWPRMRHEPQYLEPFQKAIREVLQLMNLDDFEPPFIFQHRRDYFISGARKSASAEWDEPDAPGENDAKRLLEQSHLWDIFDLDLKYRALTEKRQAVLQAYDAIQSVSPSVHDSTVESLLPHAENMEEVQDIQDYLHFQYSAELKDVNSVKAESNGVFKRARAVHAAFERLRASPAYNLVRAFGVTADSFAQSAAADNRRGLTDDPKDSPDDMADQFSDGEYFTTGSQVLRAAKDMFAEEIAITPKMRKYMRGQYYRNALVDCVRTEKGLRKIDEDHQYFEFKYLRNQTLSAFVRAPELYLKMLRAEDEGLVEVKVRLDNESHLKRTLEQTIISDNYSEVADAWNQLRKEVLHTAIDKLKKIMAKGVKEHLKTECEDSLAKRCRDAYQRKLDQAPYKPRGMMLGTEARTLAISNGAGSANRDIIHWAWVEEEGKVIEYGRFKDLRPGNPEKSLPPGEDVAAFVEVVSRRKPDVIAVSGWSVETRTLYKDLQAIIESHDLQTEYEDDDAQVKNDRIEIIQVNDEVARLYHTSDRAIADYPSFSPLTRYCVGIAKYIQSPLKQYVALGKDITSISFDPNQDLLPREKLIKHLEKAMVDIVNLVGVDINMATDDSLTANLLQYVSGLGPRKSQAMLQTINRNGGAVINRDELVGDPDNGKIQACGPKVWANCASFVQIEYDSAELTADPLDATRVHPEDYELARKMAADAQELDEEDVKAEVDESGASAIVRKLFKDDAQERVNDLLLEGYAEQLEQNFNQRKRATLETIRVELQTPYEELRKNFAFLSTEETFTMLTGETKDSLVEGMVVSAAIRRVFPDHIEAKLDCGIEAMISEAEYPSAVGIGSGKTEARSAFQPHQTVQAKITYLDRKRLTAQLSLREDTLRRPYRKDFDRMPGEWDHNQEEVDKRAMAKKHESSTGRAQRVIKHPLFRPFTAAQAEEYLGPLNRGDVVIRPSSKGLDHLAVTWKVSDNVFQHIDVLELDKENEFSVGRTLKIGGKYTYSDLDELIVNHVKAMAKKVDEIMTDERYQGGSKTQTEQWLGAYMEANPKRSMYAFCINREFPGYFLLCFKAGQNSKQSNWPVKIIPNAFELQKNPYPDMRALKNGFKTMFQHMQQNGRRKF